MAYITETDLRGVYLNEDEITAVKRATETPDPEALTKAITFAEGYIKDRLSHKYNIAVELGRTGAARKQTLVNIACHIAVWQLCLSFPLVETSDKRHYSYEQSLKEITQIEKGAMLTDLDAYSEDTPTSGAKWGYSETPGKKF